MSEVNKMAEEYISTVEVKELLTKAGNERGELNNAQRAALMQSKPPQGSRWRTPRP